MTRTTSIAIALILVAGGAAAVAAPAPPLACRIDALDRAQRARHEQLTSRMAGALVPRAELADGYALVLEPRRMPLADHGSRSNRAAARSLISGSICGNGVASSRCVSPASRA